MGQEGLVVEPLLASQDILKIENLLHKQGLVETQLLRTVHLVLVIIIIPKKILTIFVSYLFLNFTHLSEANGNVSKVGQTAFPSFIFRGHYI